MSDEYSNKLTDDILKYGFEVIMVPKTNYLPSFAYTVGLCIIGKTKCTFFQNEKYIF